MTINNFVDFGPLQLLIGEWTGSKGDDRSPEPDGIEENAYRETIRFEPIREVTNAEEQRLAVLQYRQIVHRIRDNKQIHDQSGYWMWDAVNNQIIHTFCIGRGIAVVAGGSFTETEDREFTLTVAAEAGGSEWTIQQAPFLTEKAKTTGFTMSLTVKGDTLSYDQTTIVDIYNYKQFEHTDKSTLTRKL
ncbi:heme-binding beta-barrel domain-containing protein [Reinekea marinisedimentorum]|uniref:THAP4-like heme-binding domain-containing protein n=1 Tax=Reinekea marinisedimentorum TaxID=230495 RepID=A0A4R3I9G6_9GAMM|nr:heme-binding beta-barrel domain-containing protein [Reinekea marinisedimentorum]TCS42003.1 hypothetical protein BCF53_104107 [Reinekea marinisedimentorum]